MEKPLVQKLNTYLFIYKKVQNFKAHYTWKTRKKLYCHIIAASANAHWAPDRLKIL